MEVEFSGILDQSSRERLPVVQSGYQSSREWLPVIQSSYQSSRERLPVVQRATISRPEWLPVVESGYPSSRELWPAVILQEAEVELRDLVPVQPQTLAVEGPPS